MARPTKLNKETQLKVVNAIKAGNYIETAAAYAGISRSTLYDWLKRGEREKQRLAKSSRYRMKKAEAIYVEFSDTVEKALAESEMRDVLTIGKAAEIQWQAAAWRLERKFPEKWGRTRKTKLDEVEQEMRIEKLQAQVDSIKGIADNIEDIKYLRELFIDE